HTAGPRWSDRSYLRHRAIEPAQFARIDEYTLTPGGRRVRLTAADGFDFEVCRWDSPRRPSLPPGRSADRRASAAGSAPGCSAPADWTSTVCRTRMPARSFRNTA